MDPEKLQATLRDETLGETCDLKRALERGALLEAQLKEMNPNLDSISEYASFEICIQCNLWHNSFSLNSDANGVHYHQVSEQSICLQ